MYPVEKRYRLDTRGSGCLLTPGTGLRIVLKTIFGRYMPLLGIRGWAPPDTAGHCLLGSWGYSDFLSCLFYTGSRLRSPCFWSVMLPSGHPQNFWFLLTFYIHLHYSIWSLIYSQYRLEPSHNTQVDIDIFVWPVCIWGLHPTFPTRQPINIDTPNLLCWHPANYSTRARIFLHWIIEKVLLKSNIKWEE